MSGPKCDVFCLNEEELKRQQLEQEKRLQEEQRRIREEEKRRLQVAKDTTETLKILQEMASNPLKEEFHEVYCQYQAAAVLAGQEADTFEYADSNASLVIAKMKADIDNWNEMSLACRCSKRVEEIIEETIEEMGYELIGEKESAAEKTPTATLYQYNDKTSISVIEANGQFTMEVVALDKVDRMITRQEAEQLESSMEDFCEDYERLKNLLASKNVINTKNIFHMSPSKKYARVVNTTAYQKKRKKRVYSEDYMEEATQRKRNGQKSI